MILDLPLPKKLRLSVDEDEFEEWKYQLKTFLSQSPENLMLYYTALDQDEAVESFLESEKKRAIQANSRVTNWKQKVESKSSLSSNSNSFHKSEGYQSHPESSDEEDKKQTKQKKQIPRRRSYAFMKSRFRDRSEIKGDEESEDKAEVKSKVPVGEVIELIAKELPNSPTFQSQGKKIFFL